MDSTPEKNQHDYRQSNCPEAEKSPRKRRKPESFRMSQPPSPPAGRTISQIDIPRNPTPGYQALRDLWMKPPQPLPGPDDHPFFKMYAPNAYPKPYQSVVNPALVSPINEDIKPRSPPSMDHAFHRPPVYPFIPAPSLTMEPMTPELKDASKSLESSTSCASHHSTPSLTFSNLDQDWTPESRPSTAGDSWRIATGIDLKEAKMEPKDCETGPFATETGDTKCEIKPDPIPGTDPTCVLTYMRAIPNSETSEPAAIANGQIWRSGSKKRGWRRNQWMVDIR